MKIKKRKLSKKNYRRVLERLIAAENEFESEPELGSAAYNILSKKVKGGVTDEFLKQPVTFLDIDKLVKTRTNNSYSKEVLLWKIDDEEPIPVIKHKGKYLVMDGHHRLFAYKVFGRKKINAYLIDLDKKRK